MIQTPPPYSEEAEAWVPNPGLNIARQNLRFEPAK